MRNSYLFEEFIHQFNRIWRQYTDVFEALVLLGIIVLIFRSSRQKPGEGVTAPASPAPPDNAPVPGGIGPSWLSYLFVVLLVAGAAIVIYPTTPIVRSLPGHDGGVFTYIGWRMTEGEIPYRDVWDHKPPVIFFIEALGRIISGGTLWGRNILQFIALCTGLLTGYFMMRRTFGELATFGGLALLLYAIVYTGSGTHMTEEYVIPSSFILLALYRKAVLQGARPWMALLMGIISGLAFMTKQVLIAMPVAVCVCLLVELARTARYRELLTGIVYYLLGLLLVIGGFIAYFAYHDALLDFWLDAFGYNFKYAETESGGILWSGRKGMKIMQRAGLWRPAIVGLILLYPLYRLPSYRKAFGDPILPAVMIDLPLEMYFSGLSERAYPHYFYLWLPPLSILSVVAFSQFIRRFPTPDGMPRIQVSRTLMAALVATYVLASALMPATFMRYLVQDFDSFNLHVHRERAVKFVEENSTPDQKVLVWGSESSVNMGAKRVAPTRFVYQRAIFEPYHPDRQILTEFYEGLKADPPVLVIDTAGTDLKTPPIDPLNYNDWVFQGYREPPGPEVDEIREFIYSNYEYAGRILNWLVYVRPGHEVKIPAMTRRERDRYSYGIHEAAGEATTGIRHLNAQPEPDDQPG